MEIFAISPASSRPLWLLGVIALILAVAAAALAYTAYASRNSRVELGGGNLRLVGDFWGREIPLRLLDIDSARILDLPKDSDYAPKRRTFGTGLPGYASGWFRLRNGEKALLYLSRRQEVVYIPTTDGYSLLLSVDDPERFLQALQQRRS